MKQTLFKAMLKPTSSIDYKYQGNLPGSNFSLFVETEPDSEETSEEEGDDSGEDNESGDEQQPDTEATDTNTDTKVEGEHRTNKLHDKNRKAIGKPYTGGFVPKQEEEEVEPERSLKHLKEAKDSNKPESSNMPTIS